MDFPVHPPLCLPPKKGFHSFSPLGSMVRLQSHGRPFATAVVFQQITTSIYLKYRRDGAYCRIGKHRIINVQQTAIAIGQFWPSVLEYLRISIRASLQLQIHLVPASSRAGQRRSGCFQSPLRFPKYLVGCLLDTCSTCNTPLHFLGNLALQSESGTPFTISFYKFSDKPNERLVMIRSTHPWLSAILLFGISALLSTCSSKGAANLLIPVSDEEKLGAEFHDQLEAKPDSFPVFKADTEAEKAFKNYIEGVFESVLHSVPSDDMPEYQSEFKLTIVDQDIQNAFAVPGGYIYIYTGIIKEFEDESELAGVLAHEIAHVTQRHYARSMLKSAAYSLLLDALLGDNSQLAAFVKTGFGVLAGTYMSRDHEKEADDYGTQYLVSSGRNPRGISSFFARQNHPGWHPEVLSTHPSAENRVTAVNEQVDNKIKSDDNWEKYDKDEYKYTDQFEEKTALLKN